MQDSTSQGGYEAETALQSADDRRPQTNRGENAPGARHNISNNKNREQTRHSIYRPSQRTASTSSASAASASMARRERDKREAPSQTHSDLSQRCSHWLCLEHGAPSGRRTPATALTKHLLWPLRVIAQLNGEGGAVGVSHWVVMEMVSGLVSHGGDIRATMTGWTGRRNRPTEQEAGGGRREGRGRSGERRGGRGAHRSPGQHAPFSGSDAPHIGLRSPGVSATQLPVSGRSNSLL